VPFNRLLFIHTENLHSTPSVNYYSFSHSGDLKYYIAPFSDVAFPENILRKISRKISGNFLLNRKNVFIRSVSMKTAENTGKLLHSFKL